MRGDRKSLKFSVLGTKIIGLSSLIAGGFIGEPVTSASRGGKEASEILYSGCKAVREPQSEPTCEISPESTLSIWVPAVACDTVRLEVPGQPLTPTSHAVYGGCQLKVRVGGQVANSSVEVRDARSGHTLWTLKLDRAKPEMFQIGERVRQRAAIDLEDFVATLRNKRSQSRDLVSMGEFSFGTAYVYMRLGQLDLAVSYYRHAIEYYLRAGYISNAADAAQKLAYNLQRSGLFAEAWQALADARSFAPANEGESRIWLAYQSGVISRAEEHLENAASWFERAYYDATRIGHRQLMGFTASLLADVYVAQDRKNDAERLLADMKIIADGESHCDRASLLAGMAWTGLVLAEDSSEPVKTARVGQELIRDLFEQALESRSKCVDNTSLSNIINGLAHTAFLEGRLVDARELSKKAGQTPGLSALGAMELVNLNARIALSSNQPSDAASSFKKLSELSLNSPKRREFECKAAIGQIEAAYSLGRVENETLSVAKACLDPQSSGLGRLEVRILSRRARAAGSPF
ncbi:MAG: hypothetical protein U1A78_16605 [Polyangia bacterium]